MSGRILTAIGSITVVATLHVSGVVLGAPDTARADNCLTAPNSSAPQGSHWYYRTDRANQRKCWYFRAPGQPAQQATAQATSEAESHAIPRATNSSAGAPMSISPSDIAPPLPHAKMLAVEPKPVPAVSTTSAQEGSTATSIPGATAPQASTSAQRLSFNRIDLRLAFPWHGPNPHPRLVRSRHRRALQCRPMLARTRPVPKRTPWRLTMQRALPEAVNRARMWGWPAL
jgi:hypothetical protein